MTPIYAGTANTQITAERECRYGLIPVLPRDSVAETEDFDLVVKPFGRECHLNPRGDVECIMITTTNIPKAIDPREPESMIDRLEASISRGDCSCVAICGIESILYWNSAQDLLRILESIDSLFKAKEVQGYLFLRDDLISHWECEAIKNVLTSH